ncbi:MAG TPA: dihydrolipoyllysine-residue succinyltransferase [Chloroflexi bacterium]|jgi:2-oxoglutarate dehydrogenase E2 component (dihydrolipoamide succinyltransferase)|nr:dihydrolipoyllysine-residue succinyltransferase [Chloroflexota bacterium]
MSIDVTVPALGESIVEATVGRWLKAEGDAVKQGEALVELETDKVNMEVASTGSGVLKSIVKPEGEIVNIGDVIAVLDEGVASGNGSGQAQSKPAPVAPSEAAVAPARETPPAPPEPVDAEGDGSRSTPLARRIAGEHGIDINQVPGSGPAGRVTKEDVNEFLARTSGAVKQPATTPVPVSPSTAVSQTAPVTPPATTTAGERREERVRMSRRRQTIARRLVEAQHTAAMLTTFNEVDMMAIMDIRKKKRDEFKERYGVGLGYMSFFTKAVLSALKEHTRLNAEIQGDDMVLKYYYDIGIAVSTDDGLVVPVLRDADTLSFAEIERGIASLAARARDGQLTLPELQGGTFTLTNGGIFGSLLSTPILNAPQVGILGMHKIEERPIALNGEVHIRPMMYVAVSYDHRIVDGAESVRFLVHIKERLEDPVSLLLEG